MTEVEDLILANQVHIMCALANLLADGDPENQEMSDDLIRWSAYAAKQMEAWGQSSR